MVTSRVQLPILNKEMWLFFVLDASWDQDLGLGWFIIFIFCLTNLQQSYKSHYKSFIDYPFKA